MKQHVNGELVFLKAINSYVEKVARAQFPGEEHSYHLDSETLNELLSKTGSSWKYDVRE